MFSAALSARPALADSHITTENKSDAWVWVTAYGPLQIKNLGAWCVHPGTNDHHGLHAVVSFVRLEVTHQNCWHPVYLNLVKETKGSAFTPNNTFQIIGTKGDYAVKQK